MRPHISSRFVAPILIVAFIGVYLYHGQDVIDGAVVIKACTPSEIGAFTAQFEDLSGSQLDRLCARPITMQDITAVLNETAATTTREELRLLERYDQMMVTRLT